MFVEPSEFWLHIILTLYEERLFTNMNQEYKYTHSPRRLINYVSKTGASSANALGVIAVMYSGFGCFLSWYRDTDDDTNTLAAATATGLLYKSSGTQYKTLNHS